MIMIQSEKSIALAFKNMIKSILLTNVSRFVWIYETPPSLVDGIWGRFQFDQMFESWWQSVKCLITYVVHSNKLKLRQNDPQFADIFQIIFFCAFSVQS